MNYIDAKKLIAEIERRREKCADIAADERNEEVAEYYRGKEVAYDETSTLITSLQQEPRFPECDNIVEKVFGMGNLESFEYREAEMLVTLAKEELLKSLQQEQPANMIQWTGSNLQEVIDFTGKSPKFGEWFKSWEDFENYVHSHDDILKLFCEDGSHYEVPVGAWIVKTPDGHNVPSVAKYIQQEQPLTVEKVVAQCKKFGGNPEVIQPEVDLEAEIDRYENEVHGFDSMSSSDCRNIARHFAEWQKAKMLEGAMDSVVYEVDIFGEPNKFSVITVSCPEGFKIGDKVKVIIVKKD